MRRHSVVIVVVLLLASVAGVVVLGGSAGALSPDGSSPYPDTPGSNSTIPVAVVAESGDAIVRNRLSELTFDYGDGGNFDGSVQNISAEDVSIAVSRQRSGESGRVRAAETDAVNVSKNGNGNLTVTLNSPLQIESGDRIIALFDDFRTPSEPGRHTVAVTTTAGNGDTDGPVSVDYSVETATLSLQDQTASQFGRQNVTVSGTIPSYGYVALFRGGNGTEGQLLGSTNVTPSTDPQNVSVSLNGSVGSSERVSAVVYTETSGTSLSARREGSFDPTADRPLRPNGELLSANGTISVLDAGGRLSAGGTYETGSGLFFDRGASGAPYVIAAVENGTLENTNRKFETNDNGTTIVDTGDLPAGQYAIVSLRSGSIVPLDDDATESPADDSFFLTDRQLSTTAASTSSTDESQRTETTASAAGTAEGTATTGDGATTPETTGAGGQATATTAGATGGNVSAETTTSTGGGSNLPGPGFGIVVALVALLGAGLLSLRRRG